MDDRSLPYVLPVGTKVVVRAGGKGVGAVAEIVSSPVDQGHAYRVRFNDGGEGSFLRGELVVLRHFQRDGGALEIPSAEYDFTKHVIFRCVVGSRAYGLAEEGSDTDYRGIYLPPADMLWSLFGVPEQVELEATQEVYWELEKFLVLAAKANPNVLECLHSPIVEVATPLAKELLEMRSVFVTKLVYQTYNGYVMSQFKKLSADLRNKGAVKWKHVMHLIRLLLAGVETLRSGVVPVRAGDEDRERLLRIRRGEVPWEEVEGWRLRLHEDFDRAFQNTGVRERPDYERVSDFLVRARRSMV